MTRRLIVALTGASGVIYGVRALELLQSVPDLETHAVISPSALQTLVAETDHAPAISRTRSTISATSGQRSRRARSARSAC